MSRILTIDIGAGTMDILYYETGSGLQYKAVVKSPVACVAEQVDRTRGDLLVVGCEMGGGALTRALKQRARDARVVISLSASATVHADPVRVRSYGITVVDDPEAESLRQDGRYTTITFGDLDVARLHKIVSSFGVPFDFDIVGVCAQDHGRAPEGLSSLDFRHNTFKRLLDENPFPHRLLYRADEVPQSMSRLTVLAKSAGALPVTEVFVMDSGMAAILGTSLDPRLVSHQKSLLVDVATSHTVGAALQDGELLGFFEYHTKDITLESLENLLRELADGNLSHDRILKEGGHGAYCRGGFGFEYVDIIVATGPKRGLLESTRLNIVAGAPLGDNMMTGTAGLLEAISRRKGLDEKQKVPKV